MEDDIIKKIKEYCIKGGMNKDSLKVNICEDGYVATDGVTSVMFDKNGSASSLPMHKLYGDKVASIAGTGYGIYAIIILVIAMTAFISIILSR